MARTPRTRTAGAGEQGVAIPIILWVMVMMLAFSVVAATAANNAQHSSQYQKSRDAALAAADAALNAALYRMNQVQPAPDRCANYQPLNAANPTGPKTLRAATPVNSTPDTNGVRWCPAESFNLDQEGDAGATVRVSEGIGISRAGGCQTLQRRYIVARGTDRDNLIAGGRGVSRTLSLTVTNSAANSLFTNCGVMVDEWLKMFAKTRIDSEVAVGTYTYLQSWATICGTLNMYTPYTGPPDQMRPAWVAGAPPPVTNTMLCNGPVYYPTDGPTGVGGVEIGDISMPPLTETANAGRSLQQTHWSGPPDPAPADTLSGLGQIKNGSYDCKASPCTGANLTNFKSNHRCAFDWTSDSQATGQGSNYSYDPDKRELILRGGSTTNTNCAAQLQLQPGVQYRFCRLEISGGAKLIIPPGESDSPTKVWIEDRQQPPYEGESKCTATSTNRLSITPAGKIDNRTGDPTALLIVGKGQKVRSSGAPDTSYYKFCFCSRYYIGGDPEADKQHMMVWAPHYQVLMSRSSEINGALAAARLEMQNHAAITWDERVADMGTDQLRIGLNYAPQDGSWKECGKMSASAFDNADSPASTCL